MKPCVLTLQAKKPTTEKTNIAARKCWLSIATRPRFSKPPLMASPSGQRGTPSHSAKLPFPPCAPSA